ncbi:MAG: class II aldolase/adducin family protein [Calditrichaceae bacterium]
MTERQARLKIVEIGRLMYQFRYIVAGDGNISIRLGDHILITPRGACKGLLSADELSLISLSGKVIRGRAEPSSEKEMHLTVYNSRPEIKAVVHGHPLFATSFASAGLSLKDSVLPEIILTLGKIPLAEYGTPGTSEVGNSISDLIRESDAILLENHGVLAIGRDIETAYFNLERVEHYAQIAFQAKMLGGYTVLPDEKVRKLRETVS